MGKGRARILAGPFALADVAMRPRMVLRRSLIARCGLTGCAIALGIGFSSRPALAYRPFDGTDAAVAGQGEVEVELQPAGLLRAGPQSALVAPFVVYNYGFAERWEVVLQTSMLTPLTGGVSSVAANGTFLKYVILPGVLQGQSGISIATEFGPLLPGINADRGTGFSWAGIVSDRKSVV